MIKKILCLFLVLIVVISCKKEIEPKGNTKKVDIKKQEDSVVETPTVYKDYTTAPVNFLEEKYKINGFEFPASLGPSYVFSDKSLGIFSVNYFAKSWEIQHNWDTDNSTGFFAQFKNRNIDSEDKTIISNKANEVLKREINNYYIIANFIPKEAILDYDNEFGEPTLKRDTYRYFYVYENKEWVFIKRILYSDIKTEGFDLFTDLMISQKLKNVKPISEKFQGKFQAEVDGELTVDGIGHTTYYFTITKNKIELKSSAFRGDFVCDGEYKGIEKDNILELYYDREDDRCKTVYVPYTIKKEGDDFFIKGIGGEGTIYEWIKMEIGFTE